LTVVLITTEVFGTDREDVRLALERENIKARPVWKPMHLQPVFDCSGQWSVVSGQEKKQRYRARKVGGEVAPQLNTLKGTRFNGARRICLRGGRERTVVGGRGSGKRQ